MHDVETSIEELFVMVESEPLTPEGRLALDGIRQVVASQSETIGRLGQQLQGEQAISRTDSLTGLPNVRAFDEAISSWGKILHPPAERRTEDEEATEGLLTIVDLDNFKLVNDVLGYYVGGNSTLRLVADLLRGSIRDADDLYRIGGDEFAILAKVMPDGQERLFHTIVERFRRNLSFLRSGVMGMGQDARQLSAIELEAIQVIDASFDFGVFRKGHTLDDLRSVVQETMDSMKRIKQSKGDGLR